MLLQEITARIHTVAGGMNRRVIDFAWADKGENTTRVRGPHEERKG